MPDTLQLIHSNDHELQRMDTQHQKNKSWPTFAYCNGSGLRKHSCELPHGNVCFKGVVLWAGLGAPCYIEHVHVKFAKEPFAIFGLKRSSLNLNGESFLTHANRPWLTLLWRVGGGRGLQRSHSRRYSFVGVGLPVSFSLPYGPQH